MRVKYFTWSQLSHSLMKQQMGNTDRIDINFGIKVIWCSMTKLVVFIMARRSLQYDTSGKV